MKYVGVSSPAWTIPGRRPEPELPPKDQSEFPVVDSDLLSKKHLYPSVPGVVFVTPHPKEKQEEPTPEQINKLQDLKKVRVKPHRKTNNLPTAERFDSNKASMGPGPGSYQQDLNKPITTSMPNFSFGYKIDNAAPAIATKEGDDSTAASSIYHPQYLHKEFGPAVTFPKSSKDGLNLLTGSCAPGPGFYKVPELPGNTSSTKGTFQKSKRQGLYSSSTDLEGPSKLYNVEQHTIAYKA